MIRQATIEDLPKMERVAREFEKTSAFIDKINFDTFIRSWESFLGNGIGVIFAVVEDSGDIIGAIGGVSYPDIHSGALVASEFFWFIRHDKRGDGLRLFHKFQEWAKQKGCKTIRMCHMIDSMPKKLAKVYDRLGFRAAEIHYTKELT